ncbi:hypothetical protein C8J56DRAFT_287565 [Mycena floridula]|nr:hypothetical protein C8J56DRAFT_287565 [Mycena floridula]
MSFWGMLERWSRVVRFRASLSPPFSFSALFAADVCSPVPVFPRCSISIAAAVVPLFWSIQSISFVAHSFRSLDAFLLYLFPFFSTPDFWAFFIAFLLLGYSAFLFLVCLISGRHLCFFFVDFVALVSSDSFPLYRSFRFIPFYPYHLFCRRDLSSSIFGPFRHWFSICSR